MAISSGAPIAPLMPRPRIWLRVDEKTLRNEYVTENGILFPPIENIFLRNSFAGIIFHGGL
jgi:hypothetical protein